MINHSSSSLNLERIEGRRYPTKNRFKKYTGAGWSSLVARRAHNPKVVGSNPAPATNISWMYKVSSTRLKIKYKYRRGMEQNDKSFVELAKPEKNRRSSVPDEE